MTEYSIFIPKWRHASLNQLMSCHWREKARLKKRDKNIVHYYTRKIPKATGKRRIDIHTVLRKHAHERDVDGEYKSILDALVHAGMLIDDNRAGVEIGEATYSRDHDNWGVEIKLTDIN